MSNAAFLPRFLFASLVLATACEGPVLDEDTGSTRPGTATPKDTEPGDATAEGDVEAFVGPMDAGSPEDAPTEVARNDAGDPCEDDVTPPTVAITPPSPVHVAASSTSTVLYLVFSEPVTGVEAALDGVGQVSPDGARGDAYVVTLEALERGDTERLTLPWSAVRDACGNALGSDVVIDIAVDLTPCDADADAPRLHVFPGAPIALPAGTTTTELTLLFNEPVVGFDADATGADRGASVELAGQGQEYTLTLGALAAGTTTLTLPASITDACGNALVQSPQSALTIEIHVAASDTEPPSVLASTPLDAATGVAPGSPIAIVFSEPMDRARGAVELRTRLESLAFTPSFSTDDTTLTLVPRDRLPLATSVEVELSSFADAAGNAMAGNHRFSFTTGADPCAGLPYAVAISAAPQLVDASAEEVTLALELSAAFTLGEASLSLVPRNGGAGAIASGSLTGSGMRFRVALEGVAPGELYDLAVARTESVDRCTTLVESAIPVIVREPIANAAGRCPLPPPLPEHHAAEAACDQGSNHHVTVAEATGQTLVGLGDAFSIGGSYDADIVNGGDTDHFAFEVAEDGAHATDLNVTLAYGCSFGGLGPRPSAAPVLTLFDAATATPQRLGSFEAEAAYDEVEGSGGYGFGRGVLSVAGLTGTNRYVLAIDDGPIDATDVCVGYVAYVEVMDDTRPASCRPLRRTTRVDGAPQQTVASEVTGRAVIRLRLDQPFALLESDVTLVPTNGGSGTLLAGGLSGARDDWTLALDGVSAGETYDVVLSARADTCSELQPGFVPVTILDAVAGNLLCPLPPALPQHHALPDACDARASNGSLTDSVQTGFTLAEVGDRFSAGGIYDFTTSAFHDDFYTFSVAESGSTLTELEVSVVYGCGFTGSGVVPARAPQLSVLDASGALLGTVVATDTAAWASQHDEFGFGRGRVRIGRAEAGTHAYHLSFNSVANADVCMDYQVFVELIDNSQDIACLGAGSTSGLGSGAAHVLVTADAGTATVPIRLGGRFLLEAADLRSTPVSGAGGGSLVAQSLTGAGAQYAVDLAGAAAGDVYTLELGSRTDRCGTQLAAGSITVVVTDLPLSRAACPLPAAGPRHFAAPDACGAQTNFSVATSAVTGFTLDAVGSGFSVGGWLEANGSDHDYFRFDLIADGTSDYVLATSVAYGCTFTGSGVRGPYRPVLDVLTSTGTRITGMEGAHTYDTIDASGDYGAGGSLLEIPAARAARGTNTYHMRLRDGSGFNWCMNYVFYVSLVAVQ